MSLPLWSIGASVKERCSTVPTSAADPQGAKRQRDSLPHTEEDKELIPLWLAGPVCGLAGVLGMIAIIAMVLEILHRVGMR